MDGNEAMANHILYETEEQNNFLADVDYYMIENKCDYDTAIKAITPLYANGKGKGK